MQPRAFNHISHRTYRKRFLTLIYCPHFASSNGVHLLEMVLESHVEIKRIPAVPEAHANEGAATCRRESRFLTERWRYNAETVAPSPPSSCIRRTKYRLESLTVSTAMPGYSFTGACANSSPAGQEGEWQLLATQWSIQLILCRMVQITQVCRG